eukprot:5828664-Alexandrium_andersonii.AAC.1
MFVVSQGFIARSACHHRPPGPNNSTAYSGDSPFRSAISSVCCAHLGFLEHGAGSTSGALRAVWPH